MLWSLHLLITSCRTVNESFVALAAQLQVVPVGNVNLVRSRKASLHFFWLLISFKKKKCNFLSFKRNWTAICLTRTILLQFSLFQLDVLWFSVSNSTKTLLRALLLYCTTCEWYDYIFVNTSRYHVYIYLFCTTVIVILLFLTYKY